MNPNTKKVLLIVLAVVLVGGIVYAFAANMNDAKLVDTQSTSLSAEQSNENNGRRAATTTTTSTPIDQLKTAKFVGKLEKVDTGCFADGECFVEVGGKHVTVLVGWSQGAVGSVIGVNGFGDLEQHIGRQVEVYAQDKGDGTYTLYGNTLFFIKLID